MVAMGQGRRGGSEDRTQVSGMTRLRKIERELGLDGWYDGVIDPQADAVTLREQIVALQKRQAELESIVGSLSQTPVEQFVIVRPVV